MTPNDSVELLFRCRMEGAAEVDRLAASVRNVSAATAVSSEGFANLERMIQANTAAVVANTTALDSMGGATTRTTTGLHNMAGGARVASNELRVLEGSMPIMAAGRLLSQMQGLQTAMSVAFPIFGAVALFGVLENIVGKANEHLHLWQDAGKAEKEATEELKKYSDEAARGLQNLARLQQEIYTRQHGPVAGAQRTEQSAADEARRAQEEVARLEKELAAVTRISQAQEAIRSGRRLSGAAAAPLSAEEAFYAGMAGLQVEPGAPIGATGAYLAPNGLAALQAHLRDARVTAQEAQARNVIATGDTGTAVQQQQDERARAEAERRRPLDEAEKGAAAYLRQAQTFELSGLARINEAYREKLELLGKTKQAVADITAAHAIEVARELHRITGQPVALADTNHPELDALSKVFQDTARSAGFSADSSADQKAVAAGLRVLQRGDEADADAVRRGVRPTGNATQDYQARINAANQIFAIETRHIDLIDDEEKREERLADLRKKWADEVYTAEAEYEKQLDQERTQDLEKYHQMAADLFTAVHTHSMNQWGRQFITGQAQQVFSNVAQVPLQQIGHMLGGVTGGFNPGGILTGTVFDPANKGVQQDAHATAQHTLDTVTQVAGLRSDLKGIFTGNPDPNTPVAAGGGTSSTFNPLASLPLNNSSSLTALQAAGIFGPISYSGGGSALAAAGSGSGFSGFMGGMGMGGTNPLGAIFTGQAGGPGWGAQLTGAQQAGVAFGTATALAGAGLGIASGISQGGVGGITKAASSGLGAVAMLDPDPLSKSIIGGVAALTGIIGSMFSTGPQQRQQQITDYLAKNQYLAPTALNVIQGMNGTYEDFDSRGNLRTSTMSAVPTVAEPYITKRTIDGQQGWYDAPGSVTSPYSGGAKGTGQTPVSNAPQTVINVSAIDTQSGIDFLMNNRHAVGEALTAHLQTSNGERLAAQIRYHTNG